MASEETTEPVSLSVPGELAAWLRRAADERDVDVQQYTTELLAAHRAVDAGAMQDVDGVDGNADDPLGVDERIDERIDERLDERLEEQREEFEELLEDVRGRVIQVKRETDAKAPADHDHADLAADVDDLLEEIESLAAELDRQASTVADLESTVDRGFENYEEVLEYLVDATDDLADRVDRLARATLATRERAQAVAAAADERERVDALKQDAALESVSTADCEDCGRTVDVALLTEPRCPACAATFVDVEPKRGFFGSATLVAGDLPALAGGDGTEDLADDGTDDLAGDVESVLDADRPHPGDVDWETIGDRS